VSNPQGQQIAQDVAMNLAFGLGEAGPFVAAGLSVFFGLFSSGSPALQELADEILNRIDEAVSELEQFETQAEIRNAGDDAKGFFTQIHGYASENDNTAPTLEDRVDALWTAFGPEMTQLVKDTEAMTERDILALGRFVDFPSDSALHVLVSLLTARIAAHKAVMLGARQIWEQLGPDASADGDSSATVADDLAAQKYMQRGVDAYQDLQVLIFGARTAPAAWTKLSGDRLQTWGMIQPRQYLVSASGLFYCAMCDDGAFAVYSGGGPDDCKGLSWKSTPSAGRLTPSYLVLQSDANLCVYDIGGEGQSPGPAHGPLLWQSATPTTATNLILVMQDDGNLCLYGDVPASPDWNPDDPFHFGNPALPHHLLWSTFQSWPSNPRPARTSNFVTPELSLFDAANSDLGLLIAEWQSAATTLQPQYLSRLNDTTYNPWPDSAEMADFAGAFGWAAALRQLLTFRKIARLGALGLVGTYGSRDCHTTFVPMAGPITTCSGETGYQYTDSANPAGSYSHADDYDDDAETPSNTYQDDVQSHWNSYWSTISNQLSDPNAWNQYAAVADAWIEKTIELGTFIPADAPPNTLMISDWGPSAPSSGSGWNLAATVTYAISYETESGMGLRSDFLPAEPITGAGPTLSGFPTAPDGVTQIRIWRKFVAKAAPSTTFEVPRLVGSVVPGTTSWTDTDAASPPTAAPA